MGSTPADWSVGPYDASVTLTELVSGLLTNATYGNGILVLAMPKASSDEQASPAEIRLEAVDATRGERIGHVSRAVKPATTEEHLRKHRARPP